jgi:hypothetical protein
VLRLAKQLDVPALQARKWPGVFSHLNSPNGRDSNPGSIY